MTAPYAHRPARRTSKTTTRRATRRTARRTARRYRRRLPRLGWGWALGILITGYIVVRTYPVQSIIALALLTATALVYAIRPARLHNLLTRAHHLGSLRPALPHQRTITAFQNMSPARFEQAIAELAAQDPTAVTATVVGGPDDRGMDVRVKLTNGTDVLIQCKRYKDKRVTSQEIMKVNGTYRDIHHCQQAAIVTTSNYTRSAYTTNGMLPQRMRLVTGEGLTTWANGGPPPWA